jgi:hypothetical protein
MSIRIPAGSIVISIGEDGKPGTGGPLVPHLRLDLWPTWLEIGCEHAGPASETGSQLAPDLPDQGKAELLGRELKDGMVAMCAFAFAFDGFYDVIKSELGEHPTPASGGKKEGERPHGISRLPRHSDTTSHWALSSRVSSSSC